MQTKLISTGVSPTLRLCSASLRASLARSYSILSGGMALVLLSLPILIIAALIRATSPGPVLFRQTRLGENERPFVLLKFRTMYVDALQRFPHLYDYSAAASGDFLFKQSGDPRVTPIGRLLRRTGLDELPNLVNVARGDLNWVGPRPDIPEMLPRYSDRQRIRFEVRPGVVSLAHIRGGNRLTFDETAELDVTYVRKRSFFLNLEIVCSTIAAIVRGDIY